MKRWGQRGVLVITAILCCLGVFCVAIRMPLFGEPDAVLAAAGFIFPDGAAGLLRRMPAGRTHRRRSRSLPPPRSSLEAPAGRRASPLNPAQSSRAEEGAILRRGGADDGGDGITEMTMANTGQKYGNLWVEKIQIQITELTSARN